MHDIKMNLVTIFFLGVFHKSIHSYPTRKVSLPICLFVCLHNASVFCIFKILFHNSQNQVLSSFTFFNLDENKISTELFVDPDLNELLMCRGSKDVARYNMERFITKRSILNVTTALDPPLLKHGKVPDGKYVQVFCKSCVK